MYKFTGITTKLLIGLTLTSSAYANMITVKDIRVEGNNRINKATILNYVPIKTGMQFDDNKTPDIIRSLYSTGFFSDVNVDIKNNVITLNVIERSVISKINIVGNSKITTKQLLDALKQIGLNIGQEYNQSSFNTLEQAMIQQYYTMGFYGIKIKADIKKQDNNRSILNITIDEGFVTKIQKINITGNKSFEEKDLLKNFKLTPTNWFKLTFLNHNDEYSKEKLDADLDKLKAFYMDRGYLKFNVNAIQVSLTPDKKHIYINLNVNEGNVYKVSGFDINGNLLGKKDQIQKIIDIKNNDVFSRQQVMNVIANVQQFIGDFGYASPDISINPVINDKNNTVFINFKVDPGKRYYVRRISFNGNNRTNENVLRREMRQQEGSMFVLSKVNESKRRIANLGYIENIDTKTSVVPEHPDQIDLNYTVKEAISASAGLNFGYSDSDGFLYGANITEQNLFGTGKGASVQFSNSKSSKNYGFTYYNPYHTANNVSLRFDAYAQTQDPTRIDLSSYSTDYYGSSITYGIPISDFDRINFGYGYEYIRIKTDSRSPFQVLDFIKDKGASFNEAKFTAGWSHNKLDRAIFPTQGFAQSINVELYAPLASRSLNFYRTNYNASWYYPLYKGFIFTTDGKVGYGNGLGSTDGLPFFKNYYAGGMDSVRGFDSGSIGPRDSNRDPMGGNLSTVASAGIVIPTPLSDSLRTTAFVDVGSVYHNTIQLDDLRSSAGVEFEWRSPLGILRFSLAKTIRTRPGDSARIFDFSIGTSL